MSIPPPLDCTPTLPALAPCEHIAGNEKFILKGFSIQSQHLAADGHSLVDLTLDLEDGAPVGQEEPLRHLFAKLLTSQHNVTNQSGIRIHPVDSGHCARDLEVLLSSAGGAIRYITIPKVKSVREVRWCLGLIRHYLSQAGLNRIIPLHLLIETSEALGCLRELAAIPEVQTLDFGLMDFISQAGGAIPSECMKSPGQFSNALLRHVKSQIALAALAHNAVPSHNVTVDVRDPSQAYKDAHQARVEFGFLRMWSIHPDQIEPIIRAMSPSHDEIVSAKAILAKAAAAHWGPIEHEGRLHDRASYRYYWGILTRSGEIITPPTQLDPPRP
jgi:citrate lyase subunit beta/citryl-CoA lyase